MHFANCRKPDPKVTYCMTLFIGHPEKGKTVGNKNRLAVARNGE